MAELTIGVEEEYQLVEPVTGELRSRARDVLEGDWAGELHQEVHETMLEVATRPCTSIDDLRTEIRRLRFQVASAAAAEELAPIAAGVHPFSRWERQQTTDERRYQRLLERFGRVLRTEHVFGIHVHVAVPDGTDRMRIVQRIRAWVPHLIALAASSPIYEAEDTRYASYRTILTGRLPCSGITPGFESDREYWSYIRSMIERGAILDEGSVYWSIRPHARYPTIEVRCGDACPRMEDAVLVAALARGLVAAALHGRLPHRSSSLGESAGDALLRQNEWLAARYGLEAELVDAGLRTTEPARDGIRRIADAVAPVLDSLGDADALDDLDALLRRGSSSDRLCAVARDGASLRDLVTWLSAETVLGTGLDRRAEQRAEASGTVARR